MSVFDSNNNYIVYNVGIYLRLSKEDENTGQSESIENQRTIVENFISNYNWNIVEIYIDDGFSGLNFNRPAFKRMLEDIENKKINLVITKDDCVIIEPTQKDLENQGFVAGSICF